VILFSGDVPDAVLSGDDDNVGIGPSLSPLPPPHCAEITGTSSGDDRPTEVAAGDVATFRAYPDVLPNIAEAPSDYATSAEKTPESDVVPDTERTESRSGSHRNQKHDDTMDVDEAIDNRCSGNVVGLDADLFAPEANCSRTATACAVGKTAVDPGSSCSSCIDLTKVCTKAVAVFAF